MKINIVEGEGPGIKYLTAGTEQVVVVENFSVSFQTEDESEKIERIYNTVEWKTNTDLKEIMDISWTSKKAGVIYFGGGVPKNYIQQAMQLCPKSASYGVQVTMDRPEPGGSSGAELREGISWGKMNPKAKFVDLICDATIAMPVIYAALKERINVKT